jgi:hypothetical protein
MSQVHHRGTATTGGPHMRDTRKKTALIVGALLAAVGVTAAYTAYDHSAAAAGTGAGLRGHARLAR